MTDWRDIMDDERYFMDSQGDIMATDGDAIVWYIESFNYDLPRGFSLVCNLGYSHIEDVVTAVDMQELKQND
jgi:hypothetical protein